MQNKYNIEDLKKLNNKSVDPIILFIMIDRLKRYDYKFYMTLRDKFIIEILKDYGNIKISDLNLNLDDLNLFNYWFNYMGIENLNITKILEKVF